MADNLSSHPSIATDDHAFTVSEEGDVLIRGPTQSTVTQPPTKKRRTGDRVSSRSNNAEWSEGMDSQKQKVDSQEQEIDNQEQEIDLKEESEATASALQSIVTAAISHTPAALTNKTNETDEEDDAQSSAERADMLFRNDTQRVEAWLTTITQLKELWKQNEDHEMMRVMAEMLELVVDKVNTM